MQHKITKAHNLLDENGHVIEAGYANTNLLTYRRSHVLMDHKFLKEWDYYLMANDTFGVAFSIACLGPMTRLAANFMDYTTGVQYNHTDVLMQNTSQFGMPEDVLQSIHFPGEHAKGSYIREDRQIKIKVDYQNFGDTTLKVDVAVDIPDSDAMTIVVPYAQRPDMFYYNYKLTCMQVHGTAQLGDAVYSFEEHPTYAIYDWGRGIWPQKNTWYWGSGSGVVNGGDFGFNIGYGFGDTSHASENMLFWNGKCHKLEEVTFLFDDRDFCKPWRFTSSDKRFEMDFVPVMDRASVSDLRESGSNQHQVFGKFSGKAVLENGTILEIKDFFGFAEKVSNNFGSIGIPLE